MTDPTPETTPTRDEAVLDVLAQTERRENGLRANMDEVATLAHQMIAIIRRGALRPDPQTGWLASAPAPASGRVDAVAWRTVSDFVDEMLRDWPGGDDCRMGFGLNGATVTKGQFRAVQAALASLPPAATPVSEAGGELASAAEFVAKTAEDVHAAIRVAIRLCQLHASECIDENPERQKLRLAVFTALEMPTINARQAAITARRLAEALAKPASSPAGGDVREEAISLFHAFAAGVGYRDVSDKRLTREQADRWVKDSVSDFTATLDRLAALSQSTSAGRVGE